MNIPVQPVAPLSGQVILQASGLASNEHRKNACRFRIRILFSFSQNPVKSHKTGFREWLSDIVGEKKGSYIVTVVQ